MKNHYQIFNILLVLLVIEGGNTSNVSYFQVSSSKNQLGGPNAKVVTYNSIDGSNDYTVFNNGSFGSERAGTFFAMFATQIGSPSRNGEGNVHIWIRIGDWNKPNSNSIQTVRRGTTSVLIYQTVFQAPANGIAALIFTAFKDEPCTSLGLIVTAPENEPLVPSIINSLIQLSDGNNTIPYAELTSSQTQLGSSKSKAVTLDNISGVYGIDVTTAGTNGAIKYNKSGLYFAIACAQVGSDASGKGDGEVHLWLRLNGKDTPNSNTIQTIHDNNTAVLISQTIVKLTAGDQLQLMFSATYKKLGLIASTPQNEPAVPSMIFSTFRLDSKDASVPYAQLSSSTTQWGCITPQKVQLNNVDGIKYITNNDGTITFQRPGTYFLIAAAQVASVNDKGVGDVHLWMRVNGVDLANSNTIQTVNGDTAVLISQTVIVLKTNDKLQLMFSTDVTYGKLGLVASKPKNEPTVPSMIFSAYKSVF